MFLASAFSTGGSDWQLLAGRPLWPPLEISALPALTITTEVLQHAKITPAKTKSKHKHKHKPVAIK